jgi:hypothetical protein
MVWPVRTAGNFGLKVFQTGQRHCYNEIGERVTCEKSGQDGEFQSGLPLHQPRFIEHADQVYDRVTNLIWLTDAKVNQGALDWKAGVDWIIKLNREGAHGYRNWRLPTIAELEGLIDMGRYSPALPVDHPFVHVQEFYWSSTTSVYNSSYAWVLYMTDGAVGVGFKVLSEFYIWPVRNVKV